MTDLPSGIVTFLLTDITTREGSTALWERDPEAMRHTMARHDALLTTLIEGRGGSIIRTRGEGDSAFAVFSRASDALAAAWASGWAMSMEQAVAYVLDPDPTPVLAMEGVERKDDREDVR